MKCAICGTQKRFRREYRSHARSSFPKSFVKRMLRHFDFLIPASVSTLKRLSSTPFRGYVSICSNCGYGEMENPPTKDELQDYYQELYWTQRSPAVNKATSRAKDYHYKLDLRAIHQIDFVSKHIDCRRITRLLEIGAGAAYPLLLMRDRCATSSANLFVCEPGRQWEEYYRSKGIEKVADYFPFETVEGFDYIHTSHWLEHVADLDETLSILSRLVRPGGYIFVEVPNTEHDYWDLPVVDTPHIHFFTRSSLTTGFENNQFECIQVGEYGLTYLERYNGVDCTPDRYGRCENGYWIRALFKKLSA